MLVEGVTVGGVASSTQLSNDQFFGVEGGAGLVLESPELVGPPNQWGKQAESFSRPFHEDYPLASRPHLLKPFARKEVLFGGGTSPSHEGGGAGGGVDRVQQQQQQQEGGHRRDGGRKGRKRKHGSTSDRNR